MASSIPAFAASLENVAARLRRMCGTPGNDDAKVMYRDLEDDDEIEDIADEAASGADNSAVRAELTTV
ncbi:MAG: hypothetical protein ACRD4F_11505, partial [Candidatus Angelobacter sp.]